MSIDGSANEKFPVKKLVLAAGPICTAEIFLESIYRDTGEIMELHGLMDDRQILVPFVNLKMIGRTKLRIFFFDHLYLFALLLLFILAAIFVNPIGDFPLNDDFQYAYAVHKLRDTGTFTLGHKISPNVFLQVY